MGTNKKKNQSNEVALRGSTLLKIPTAETFTYYNNQVVDGQEERRRVRTTFNTSRINNEAEQIATRGRRAKVAKQNQKAYDLYTAALALDPYNHMYYHHRAELCFSGEQPQLGVWDAQAGLDLCTPLEDYKDDECFALLWCTLTMCCMRLRQFVKAKKFCELGIANISDNNPAYLSSLRRLNFYHTVIVEQIGTHQTDIEPIIFKSIGDAGDDLSFVYSIKVAWTEEPPRAVAPNQPELLAVDIDKSMPVKEMFDHVGTEMMKEWTNDKDMFEKKGSNIGLSSLVVLAPIIYAVQRYKDVDNKVSSSWVVTLLIGVLGYKAIVGINSKGEKREKIVFQVPGKANYWVTAIPVFGRKDTSIIQKHLMPQCMKDTKIVILKLEKSEEPPVVDTDEYVSAIVKNASLFQQMYGKGERLVDRL